MEGWPPDCLILLCLKQAGFENRTCPGLGCAEPGAASGAGNPVPGSCRAKWRLPAGPLPEMKRPRALLHPGDSGATLPGFVAPSSSPTSQAQAPGLPTSIPKYAHWLPGPHDSRVHAGGRFRANMWPRKLVLTARRSLTGSFQSASPNIQAIRSPPHLPAHESRSGGQQVWCPQTSLQSRRRPCSLPVSFLTPETAPGHTQQIP